MKPHPDRSSRAVSALLVIVLIFLAIPAQTLRAQAARQFLHGQVPEAVRVSSAVAPLAASQRMNLAVGLPLRNQQELDTLLKDLFDPSSPNFHHYLTPAQFAARFGPTDADYQALAAFFGVNGFTVTGTHPNRMILDISGRVTDINRTLHVNMMTWRHPTRGEFFAPDREPSLDAGVTILDITGLDDFVVPHPMDLRSRLLNRAQPLAKALTTGSGPAGLFTGNDFRSAYAPSVSLNGAGQSVGLFELDGFYASDVAANFQQAGLPPVPVKTVLLDGFSGAPGGANVEVTLDIMMASYMAPGVNNIIVYEGTNWNDVLNRMATDNAASQLSSSWSFSPTNSTTEQIFSEMIAQGQSLFQASGDDGAYHGSIMPPADDPNVTVVGGTSLTTAGAGGAWQSEVAWGDSGGGVSTTWPIPSYQKPANMTAAGGSGTMRNIPDVALLADVQIFLICDDGEWIEVGGTSAAAPLWAGFLALANQQSTDNGKPRVGFLNPTIYGIGGGSSFSGDLHDITSGSNNGFSALPGYDLVTGWGTPQGQSLIDSLTAASGQPSFGLTASSGSLTIGAGSSGTSTITVSPENGFSGTVSLAASGLPSGVTASFSPATATTSSTLTLIAASTAAASTSTITITGTSGSLAATGRLQLTITTAPDFSIGASPASVSVVQGSHTTSTLTVAPVEGFTGSVSLAVSGLPTGVTASLSPVSTTKSSTLTLNATSSATPGSYTATITGTSGSLKNTAAISLTITGAPSFSIAASPASLSVVQGASETSTIAMTPAYGFDSTVTFTASGLPSGVTASFGAMTSGASIITFKATSTATAGVSTVTITGTSGSISSKTKIALTITAEPSFTLAASPTNLAITPGAGGTSTVTITALHGFDDTVALTASGLPAGVTASIGTATSGKSVVTFSAASSAAAGTSTITITGTSGSLTSKATLALTVTPPPSFSLTAFPSTLSVSPGKTGTSSIEITDLHGFNGAITLAASGLPSGVTASFGAIASGKSTVTFTAASTAASGVSAITVTGTSGSLTSKAALTLTVTPPPSFSLSATTPTLTVTAGASVAGSIVITDIYGFNGAVALAASNLPTGVTAAFGPVTSGRSVATFSVASTVPSGSSPVTITGSSGNLTIATSITLTVRGSSSPETALVSLSSLYNVPASVTDFSAFTSGGLDGGGRAYSANLLGTVQNVNGVVFNLAPANVPGAVSGSSVPLPAGQYAAITLLATAVNGSQAAQRFTVTYTDGSTSTFIQNLSDWCTPQNYPGESLAVPMSYRDNSNGTRDTRSLALYAYTFNLTSGKTAKSIALPNNRNVVVLAMSLGAAR
ncbi:MAG TPA: protease pro-enzyme activation domain-containing protein [Bryobacteraceae bacterium]|nr:protease pro-enzyme activation domain-containing protein [Bryobacteraceae bacterium]